MLTLSLAHTVVWFLCEDALPTVFHTAHHSVEYWSGRIFDQPKIQDKIRFTQIYFPKGFLYRTGNNNI